MQLETRYHKLERLVKSEHIDEVNEMLLNGVSPHTVAKWLKDRDFTISHPKLYEYKEMLQTAIAKRITVERLLGIGVPKRTPIQLQALGASATKNMVRNEMEILDGIIQLGMSSLTANPTIRLQDAMRAIELKTKLTGGAHGGLTTYGLEQLRELETRKFQAIIDVVLKYLPEDKHAELDAAISAAERKFYEEEAPEYLEEYDKAVSGEIDEALTNKGGDTVEE